MIDDLQKPRRENGRHEQPFFQRHVQPPNARHREDQDDEIGNDVEDARGLKGSIDAEAMARRHERVPDPLPRSTNGNLKDSLDEIKD